ncbi:putative endonuclease [Desulfacinum hydrothermale DSM 13146]|uniref:UPF0102 protein SAMN02746041_02433 n=1 Tax=Desulfacinum hydrothermale DSM 13146 TaxID=1121390 RepID=A0A1W1XPK4_9BACT|nr:YraN family protein [Desulfacinum hydrothermale]SMC25804.1 putative endonuclease [Desulfacinum hydrothermale DSM 13146]
MTLDERRKTGREGEAVAEAYLRRQGLKIVEKNVRCALGELDLVARDGDRYVFVEVRSHRSRRWGSAKESVSVQKRRKLVQLAFWYLKSRNLGAVSARFDVVVVHWRRGQAEVSWIPNAFDAAGDP